MTRPVDKEDAGTWILRDHREDVEPGFRNVMFGCLLERRDASTLGRRVIEGLSESTSERKSAADIQGAFLIDTEDDKNRSVGSWSFAMPVLTTSASKKKASASDTGGTTVRRTGPGASAARAASRRPVKFRPVYDRDWGEDDRYQETEAFLHPDSPDIAAGESAIVLAGMYEKSEELLLLPLGAGKLIAVNRGNDPAVSSTVYDTDAEDKPDPLNAAKLHSFWKTYQIAGGCAIGKASALTWQLGLSDRDRIPGRGLVTDAVSPPIVDKEDEPVEIGGPNDPAEAQEGSVGRVTFGQDYANALRERIRQAQEGSTGSSTGRDPGPTSVRRSPSDPGPTSVRNLTTSQPPPAGDLGLALAAMTSKMGGPIDVGSNVDVHRLGTTTEGHAINSAHISTLAYFRGGRGDGPLNFEDGRWEKADEYPFMSKVHLRWNRGLLHDHPCGKKIGMWALEAEIPLWIPEDDEPPPPPEPPPEDDTDPPPIPFPPQMGELIRPGDCKTTPGSSTGTSTSIGGAGGAAAGGAAAGGWEPDGRDGDFDRGAGDYGLGLDGGGEGTDFGGVPITPLSGPLGDAFAGGALGGAGSIGGGLGGSTGGAPPGATGATSGGTTKGGNSSAGPTSPSGPTGIYTGPIGEGPVSAGGSSGGPRGGRPRSPNRNDQKKGSPYKDLELHLGMRVNSLSSGGVQNVSAREYDRLFRSGVIGRDGKPINQAPRVGDTPTRLRTVLGGAVQRTPTFSQQLRTAGGLVMRPFATARGELDATRGGFIRRGDLKPQVKTPDTTALVAHAVNQTGRWDGWTSLGAGVPGGARHASGGHVVVGSMYANPTEFTKVLDGDFDPTGTARTPDQTTTTFIPGGMSVLSFSHPKRTVLGGAGIQMTQGATGLAVRVVSAAGVVGSNGMDVKTTGETNIIGSFRVNGSAVGTGSGVGSPSGFGGDGTDGATTIGANTEATGQKQYSTLTVSSGFSLYGVESNILALRATGAVVITGTVNMQGKGETATPA